MNKLKFIGILLVGFALLFVGCDALQAGLSSTQIAKATADQAAIDNAVATISKISAVLYLDKDGKLLAAPTKVPLNLDDTAIKVIQVGTQWTAAYTQAVLDITADKGGTVDYVAGTPVDLTAAAGVKVKVTSKDGTATKTYTLKVTFVPVPTNRGVIGTAAGGWSTSKFVLVNGGDGTYTGVTYLTAGEFKFNNGNNPDGSSDWTDDCGMATSSTVADANHQFDLVSTGESNLVCATAGFYYLKLDYVSAKITVMPLASLGVIGDATPGGWNTDTNLTGDTTTDVFTASITFNATGSWKFRANAGWDINWGAGSTAGIGKAGGDNFATPGAGPKTVTFNGRTFAYTVN